jgi:DNA polymerase III epsilon subunit-like protein
MSTIYSRHSPGKYFLAIDHETSGSDFGGDSSKTYQSIAFGAVIASVETLEPVETLYREMHFDDTRYQWTAEAEKIHGLSREHLAAHGVPREEALADLLDLILRYIGTESKIMFGGHNVDFDIAFTEALAADFGVQLKVHHVKLDTSSTAFICIGEYRSDDVFEFFTGKVRTGAHDALDDALMTLETMRNIRALINQALQ